MMALLSFAACGGGSGSRGDGTGPLAGRVFLSQAVIGHTLVPGTRIRLSFDDGQVGAHAGCNSLGAPYQVVDGRLVVRGGMTMTEMGCDPLRHAQDEWLGAFLRSGPGVDLDGDTLTLTSAGATLSLLDRVAADPDRPLVGTRWRVDTVIRGDAASSVPEAGPVTLEFNADGTLAATSAGCTSARLDVGVDQGTLRFGELVVDAIGCPPPWETTVELLRAPDARYSITAARLTITAGGIGIAAVAD